jgi:hypothetical protein
LNHIYQFLLQRPGSFVLANHFSKDSLISLATGVSLYQGEISLAGSKNYLCGTWALLQHCPHARCKLRHTFLSGAAFAFDMVGTEYDLNRYA